MTMIWIGIFAIAAYGWKFFHSQTIGVIQFSSSNHTPIQWLFVPAADSYPPLQASTPKDAILTWLPSYYPSLASMPFSVVVVGSKTASRGLASGHFRATRTDDLCRLSASVWWYRLMRADLYTGPKTTQPMRTMVNVNNIRLGIRNVCNFWWSWRFQLNTYRGVVISVKRVL